ncbi:GNAT family N-acetyltransferase [Brachybacterium fresconis]|uniref:RimJ/RimL family protein N-acetyltransferase n=1 Tax=Brachybacterium fresconis TaxID=173363 RepID=A0ABS4YL98_9MICO|nr:RimJ/RimL family protein N-acetyltransferase [Brachybacterium fresconis]
MSSTPPPDSHDPAAPSPAAAAGPVDREQVTLRLLTAADAPALVDLETRNRDLLLIGAPDRSEDWFTEAGQRTAIAHALGAHEAGRSLPLGIWLEEHDRARLVGRLTLSGITRGAFESASLGYWVDHLVTGRGIATHAVRAAIAVAFGALRLHRLQAEVQVGNDASVHLLQRCGFAEYGLAPSYLRLGGEWADCRLFQLVDARWRPTDHATEPAVGADTESVSARAAGTAPESAAEPGPGVLVVGPELPELGEVLDLYDAVGWSAYTDDPATLERAFAGSSHVVTARRDGELLGLARVLSDGATLAYLQDVLVRPEVQQTGLGRRLVAEAFAPYGTVRQQVLLTDAEPGQWAFYEALGFTEVHDHEAGLRSFVRLR